PHLTPPLSPTHTHPPHTNTLSLHDALPISYDSIRIGGIQHARCHQPLDLATKRRAQTTGRESRQLRAHEDWLFADRGIKRKRPRSEEHTSELQSRENLVCRLLLEKKKHKER